MFTKFVVYMFYFKDVYLQFTGNWKQWRYLCSEPVNSVSLCENMWHLSKTVVFIQLVRWHQIQRLLSARWRYRMLNWLCRMVYKSALSLLSWFIDRYSYGWRFDTILWKDIHELSWFVLQHFLLSVELMLQVKLLPGGISSFLRSVNLILFTLLLAHLILCISPCHSHHLCSHHLSLPRSFTPDLHLICSQILSSIFFLVPSRILDLLSTGVEMSFARSLMVLFSSVQSL